MAVNFCETIRFIRSTAKVVFLVRIANLAPELQPERVRPRRHKNCSCHRQGRRSERGISPANFFESRPKDGHDSRDSPFIGIILPVWIRAFVANCGAEGK